MHRVVLAIALTACSHPAQPARATSAPAAAETSTAGDIAPSLFTVEQLRAGNPPGRVIEYRAEAEGKPTKLKRYWFAVDLPGPPIQFMTEQAGKVVQRAQMLRAR